MIRTLALSLLVACRQDEADDSGSTEATGADDSPWEVVAASCPLEPYNESWGVLAYFDEAPVYIQAELCYFEDAADEVWCWQDLDSYLTPSLALIVRSDWCGEYEDATFEVAYSY